MLFLPSFVRGWPSLARRTRAFCSPAAAPLSGSPPVGSSSMACSGISASRSAFSLLVSKLVGAPLGLRPLDTVCRRPKAVPTHDEDASAASMMAAVMAATLWVPLFIDFRRVTRLFEWRGPGPRRTDCELVREWGCRLARPEIGIVEDSEGRCVKGRDGFCISCGRIDFISKSSPARARHVLGIAGGIDSRIAERGPEAARTIALHRSCDIPWMKPLLQALNFQGLDTARRRRCP
ncbi:hypothetical protein IMZ48_21345 [Candidatus Bathyarchaeota archaeon]|nr:hypothetical protein [Candidatus Bathyarchaeota archaeon]